MGIKRIYVMIRKISSEVVTHLTRSDVIMKV